MMAGSDADSVTRSSRSMSAPTSIVWVATTYRDSQVARATPARIRGYQVSWRYSRSTGRTRPVSSAQLAGFASCASSRLNTARAIATVLATTPVTFPGPPSRWAQ